MMPVTTAFGDVDSTARTFDLSSDSELRFEVAEKSKASVTLAMGNAEIFGTELAPNKPCSFPAGAKVAVHTFHGCKLVLTGSTEVAYVATETPMTIYFNTHVALEQMRSKAESTNQPGPRCMVVGPLDVGKSTLCRLLCNYGVRMGRSPVFVDVDVGQNNLGLPGTIGALAVEKPADTEAGFCDMNPLIYHFGHNSPVSNLPLYNLLIANLAEVVKARCKKVDKSEVGGVIINTCGWTRAGGYQSLIHTAACFEVDLVIVLDQERLYSELQRDVANFVKVILLPKSGGVAERSKETRAIQRDQRIQQYFYGFKKQLHPQSFEVGFHEVRLFKVGDTVLPDSLVPMGHSADGSQTRLVPVTPGASLVQRVLSISLADSEDEVLQCNVAGFLVVTAVDVEGKSFTVLSPAPRPLPNNILLISDLAYTDAKYG